MIGMIHLTSVFCLWAVFSSVDADGWRFTCHGWCNILLFKSESRLAFVFLPLILAIPSTTIVSLTFFPFYRNRDPRHETTKRNFCFLLVGLIVAVINASLYAPVT
ncbi:membrane protein [Rhodopirellula sp. SWK7]|nr:membrane protein [Rhodopirellula sp. SWK7]